MKLQNFLYADLAEKIKKEKKKIIVYGAGMIGQIVVPDFIMRFQLEELLQFYVDMDHTKQGREIKIGGSAYKVRGIEALQSFCKDNSNCMILITNSHFYSVIKDLDEMEELKDTEACVIPFIQIAESKCAENPGPVKKSEQPLIPRIIHYCWFSGREMPDYLKKCIASWKVYCPDYEIVRWDESNYEIDKNLYMKQAYEHRKWGFVPDYARLDILYHHGGIYLDTDVELVKNLDILRYQSAFCGVEKWGNINLGGCSGAVPHHPMIEKLLETREKVAFVKEDGSLNLETCGVYETRPFVREGMQVNNRVQSIHDMTVYSSDYFHPYDYMSGDIKMTNNTFSIHHFNGGWLDEKAKMQREKTQMQYYSVLQRMENADD